MGKFDMADENVVSRISAGTVIKGEIVSPNDIRIDCTFDGKLVVKGKVIVGETASIKGDVICDNAEFWGKMDGNVYVKDTLVLKNGCVVNASLNIRKLAVELGSVFNGDCKMISESEFDSLAGEGQKAAKPAATAAPAAGQQHNAAPAN
ncbi:MAG: polymer-forming cytoskeletal protein [Bacteroidales bacterium]|nr:polymer-forming cytoskeletal protein [Bacteroidales bacterium]MDE6147164.1 polymer-forming cytoskeletal protein [Bacteroidales bacterium]